MTATTHFKFWCAALLACMALHTQAQTVNAASGLQNVAMPKSWTADNGNGTFTNPLFYDEFSDPDVIRVGDDYYLAGTTMHAVPGLVILHSKDLVNWEFASYCFDRFDFTDNKFALKNHEEIYGQGIWAPCIRYANGQFYVFSNINGKGLQCYTAKDIHGPWTHHNMQGNIYDLGVLFDDDGKIYAIHGYGTVKCTELKPDMSGPVEGTERVIIPEGNGVGEGHHMYKIDGMYYLISTDYSPNGRTLCSRSKSIWGPYETRVITADETYGYHAASLTQVPRGTKYRIGEDGTKFQLGPVDKDATACSNAHQGGIVQAKDGTWWALFMQDFHSIGRTVCLMPMTWEDGWPMVGLKGNLGRAPRTWFKPDTKLGCYAVGEEAQPMRAPYNRSDDFNGKQLGRIWQWNHNPDDKLWSLRGGRLRIQSQPAEQLMWARNTLTQRVIGPKSVATVELYTKGMKDGDVCGLGNINVPCSWIGIMKDNDAGTLILRSFSQYNADPTQAPAVVPVGLPDGKIWLRCIGDYDNDKMQYAYSTDGKTFQTLGQEMTLSYQLITFQGSRHALFAFNIKGKRGGYAEFDNFTVDEPCADRSANIPYGKTIRIINKATGRPMIALKHGVLYDTHAGDNSELTQFKVIDRGQGRVALQCVDGRYVKVYGDGLPGDVRFYTSDAPFAGGATLLSTDDVNATTFLWQDYLDHDFMLLSLKNHKYLGKSPTTGSPYSWDFAGPDPDRRNGSVLMWEEVSSPKDVALKPRLVVCTDIAPADVEPDDMESMVRLMAYADQFEIEALVTSVGWNCDPYPKEWAQYLTRVIDAYGKDVPKLMRRSAQTRFLPMAKEEGRQYIGYWPSADYLRSRAVMGSEHGGIGVIGEGNDSPGSNLLIRLADEPDPRPIYVAAWGGANTLAQAIWRVKQTRSAAEVSDFVKKFRIYTITDQDMQYSMRMNRAYSSHQWLRQEFKDDLQFIWDEGTWQEQCELGKRYWQEHKNFIQNRGALGSAYPDFKWGVEGDTPSFLYLMPNGLNSPEDPRQAGWAGYHERGLCADSLTTAWTSWQEPVRSKSVGYKQRFYPDELNDFKARMQWADEGRGNHNPQVVVKGDAAKRYKAGDTFLLDASQSVDPDGDSLTFHWWQQPEIGKTIVTIDNADQPVATVHIPSNAVAGPIHLICEVHDNGPFHLVSYRRMIIQI